MDKKQIRLRFTPDGLHVREAREGESERRTIEGRAIVFDTPTVLYDTRYEKLTETIAPSCITEEFLAEQDIKLNLLHEREYTVARSNKGKGALKLEIREDGLYFTAEMPKCDIGERALALVENGTYIGCSFEFYPKDYTMSEETTGDGKCERAIVHTAFEKLDALTIAMEPAYDSTTVGIREAAEAREAAGKEPKEASKEEAKAKNANTFIGLREIIDEGDAMLINN